MSTVHLDQETDRRPAALATATGNQPEDIVREALQAYLEDLEDIEAAGLSCTGFNSGRKAPFL